MQKPVALKLVRPQPYQSYAVEIDDNVAEGLGLKGARAGPTILLSHAAVEVPASSVVLVDKSDITAAYDGDYSQAILLVIENVVDRELDSADNEGYGDKKFLLEADETAPRLTSLVHELVRRIRSGGVDGSLVKKKGGRWVNSPINSFTLKVQPRVGNVQFTLYGNPDSFDDMEFLKKDQNSYSRGWVKNTDDIERFCDLVIQSHSRKQN